MVKRKLQISLVCKTESGDSVEIGEGELGVSNELEAVLGRETMIRVVASLLADKHYHFRLDLSEKTLMALRNAIEEAPEDPLGHVLAARATVPPTQPQPVTIMALDGETRERIMLIEIHPKLREEPSAELLESFQRCMFGHRVFNGLFITHKQTRVVRDFVNSRDYETNVFRIDLLDTEKLLEKMPNADVEGSVRSLLACLSAGSWSRVLPKEAYPAMIPFVVGSLAGAVFQDWEVSGE